MTTSNSINYVRWKRIILTAQLATAGLVFLAELYGSIALYVTRSQGYGPDTIVQKVVRYLALTTLVNLVTILAVQLIVNRSKSVTFQKYVLILGTVALCANVAFSHYQFTIVFATFAIPMVLSILYEDKVLCNWTALASALCLAIAVWNRGRDPQYRADISVEGVTAFIFILSIYVLARICLEAMVKRRAELDAALIGSEKAKYIETVEQMSQQMVETLASAIDAKDRYTKGHSFRVAEYSAILARKLGWPKERIATLRYEALLHDVGKIGVPDSVLNKDGKLTEVEFNVIRSHAAIGAEILKNVTTLPDAKSVARCHHERYDGKGYPAGLAGEDIPVNARIVGLADAYDAMSSDRIYRKALSKEKIREEFVKGRGTQFDPVLLDFFLELFDRGELEMRPSEESERRMSRGLSEEFIDDLRNYITEVTAKGDYRGAFTVESQDFTKIYSYLKKLGERYGHTIEVVMVVLTPQTSENVSDGELESASHSMESAIQKSIRTVDICIRYSARQFLAVMLDAGSENVDAIMQRIFLDYYKLCGNRKVEPSYQLN